MRGEILFLEADRSAGYIHGDDLKRYYFSIKEIKNPLTLRPGANVDFIAEGSKAREIVILKPAAHSVTNPVLSDGGSETLSEDQSVLDYFLEAYSQKYVTFSGRARRAEYWSFMLVHTLILFFLIFFIIAAPNASALQTAAVIAAILYIPASVIPVIALTVRRLHDIGLSGWFYLVIFLPLGSVALVIMALLRSQKGANQYGAQPVAY